MRTLLVILALLISGSTFAEGLEDILSNTTRKGCYGINQTANFKDLAALMQGMNGAGSSEVTVEESSDRG